MLLIPGPSMTRGEAQQRSEGLRAGEVSTTREVANQRRVSSFSNPLWLGLFAPYVPELEKNTSPVRRRRVFLFP